MSRLIDADAITRSTELTKKIVVHDLTPYIKVDDLLDFIDNLPTAYDAEKVVAKLKEKKDEASIEAGKRSVRIFKDEYEDDPYYEGKKHAYGHAIELLRKGAVWNESV